jgi:hypothetical protein
MKTSSKLFEYLGAVAMVVVSFAIYLAWRSFLGQDGGVMRLFERLF